MPDTTPEVEDTAIQVSLGDFVLSGYLSDITLPGIGYRAPTDGIVACYKDMGCFNGIVDLDDLMVLLTQSRGRPIASPYASRRLNLTGGFSLRANLNKIIKELP